MFDVERLVDGCRAALRERAPVTAVREVVARAMAEPAEVARVLGTPRWGGIDTLHRSPELTVLKVVWAPGMAIYPHDHRMWAVIGLYGGREDNVFYRRTARGLAAAGGRQLDTTDTVVLGPSIIHSVANPLEDFTGAIHVYGGDFFTVARTEWDPETLQARPFDVEGARRVFAEANARWQAGAAPGADAAHGPS